jgi:transcriptional regulator with GAF, ATPase, and Fis domain
VSEIVGSSPGLRRMMERVAMVAATNTNVLITGETGTGKELVARAIHEASPRRERLLVTVNCAAISAGWSRASCSATRRARSPARSQRKGRFELAHGGTLFLDEIGELPLETQVKLLRVLQEREFERVGGSETIRVDVRVVAATNRNLPDMVARGHVPRGPVTTGSTSSRSRCRRCASGPRTSRCSCTRSAPLRAPGRQAHRRRHRVAMWRLMAYHWPGNVRELQNVIERAVILVRGAVVDVEALPELGPMADAPAASTTTPEAPTGQRTIAEVERGYVEQVLTETNWVIEGERGAARRWDCTPTR